jgi:hypothetical protein
VSPLETNLGKERSLFLDYSIQSVNAENAMVSVSRSVILLPSYQPGLSGERLSRHWWSITVWRVPHDRLFRTFMQFDWGLIEFLSRKWKWLMRRSFPRTNFGDWFQGSRFRRASQAELYILYLFAKVSTINSRATSAPPSGYSDSQRECQIPNSDVNKTPFNQGLTTVPPDCRQRMKGLRTTGGWQGFIE